MIKIYRKIPSCGGSVYTLPNSLKWRKELQGINIDGLHLIDVIALVYSLRIDNAVQYLRQKGQEQMRQNGISSITPATEEDFDKL